MFIPFFKIHIVEVIVDLGSYVALLPLMWLFSLELFDKSSLEIMSGECISSIFHQVDLLAVTVTHLWLVYGQQKEITCCFLLISDRARLEAYCTLAGSHTKFTSTKQMGRGKKGGGEVLLKRRLRGTAAPIIQHFQRLHISGISPVWYCLTLWKALLQTWFHKLVFHSVRITLWLLTWES